MSDPLLMEQNLLPEDGMVIYYGSIFSPQEAARH
jgi:alkylated DNA repair dioxygenase AlkB